MSSVSEADRQRMAHALRLGLRGLGRVWPWPSVGCVIVKDGRVVGRGTSDATTVRHAEVVALQQASDKANGATAYVTLEPCSHHGRTPPCADALIAAGIARVVVAIADPNPQVGGAGLDRLRNAGIDVVTGVLAEDAEQLHTGFLNTIQLGRPMVTLKLATTLDGRIATATGESRWITGPAARRAVHAMRLNHDAVLVGGGTARADNPTLTVRELGANHQPVRIVASRRLNLTWPNRLAATIDQGPVWLIHGEGDASADDMRRWSDLGARCVVAPVTSGQIDPGGMLRVLAKEGLTTVFCEGGGAFAASLLNAGVVDRLVLMSAGLALGAEGQPAIGALGVSALAEAERFQLVEAHALGDDALQIWHKKV